MRVLAVPRSIARSLENIPRRELKTIGAGCLWGAGTSKNLPLATRMHARGQGELPRLISPEASFIVDSMLKFMRKNASSPWIKATFLGIVVVFIFWGVGGMVRGDK